MQRFSALAAMCLLSSLLAGCSVPRGAALSSEILKEQGQPDAGYQVVAVSRSNAQRITTWPVTGWNGAYNWIPNARGPSSPIIRSGDQISLSIWDSQENSLLTTPSAKEARLLDLVVSAGGNVFIPYVGDVQIRNLTPEEAREKVQTALEPIISSAQVQLSVSPGQQNSVDLVGGVAKPGSYPLPGRNYTILSLLSQGGGIQESLRNPVVRLIRDGRNYEVRADKLLAEPKLDTTLRGNDKVVVDADRRYFTALGATGNEELVYFDRERISAMEALAMIGGLSDARADLNSVLVLRDYPVAALRQDGTGPQHRQVIFTFDLTRAEGLFAARQFGINPMDTVFATEASVTKARAVMGVIGSLVGVSNAASSVGN